MIENYLLIGSLLLLAAVSISRLSGKFGVPVLVLFLIVGMLFGGGGAGIGFSFNDVGLTQSVGIIALSIILFSGGMDTRFADIRPVLMPGVTLATLGVLLTALLTGGFIYLITQSPMASVTFSLPVSLLLASTMASTDSASVFNLLRSRNIGLKNNLQPLLELESGSNDPVAYLLTVLMIDIVMKTQSSFSFWEIMLHFVMQLAVGVGVGLLSGKATVWITNRIRLANSSLYSILLLAIVFLTFTVAAKVGGNGYLAVYLAGMVVGNSKMRYKMETGLFMEGATWLMQTIMFIILGLLVNPRELIYVAPIGLLIGAFVMLVARPVSVFACMLPFKKFDAKSKCFISWVGLRGAVPILFATYPLMAGVEGASDMFNIVFFITLLSLLLQGTTIPRAAKLLGLSGTRPKKGNDFGVLYPDDMSSEMVDLVVTEKMLKNGNTLSSMKLPKGHLVVLIKRGGKYIVPDGTIEIKVGDKLLVIRQV